MKKRIETKDSDKRITMPEEKTKEKQGTNRNYKDSVFQMLFSERENLLELCNALEGTEYGPDTEIELETLEEALFNRMINDLAFRVDRRYIILTEHQSTGNDNMPLRLFLYLAREYERLLDLDGVHRRKRMRIPTPHLYVLYNGREPFPEEMVLNLSDAYEVPETEPMVEVRVKVININKPFGNPVLQRSKTLTDYSLFVNMIRARLDQGAIRDEAIRLSIKECMEKGILKEFLEVYGGEVANKMFKEYTFEDIVRIRTEEAMEDGWNEGMEKGLEAGMAKGIEQGIEKGIEKGIERGINIGAQEKLISLVCKKLAKGKTTAEIADELEETEDMIRLIRTAAEPYQPDYDPHKIYEAIYRTSDGD